MRMSGVSACHDLKKGGEPRFAAFFLARLVAGLFKRCMPKVDTVQEHRDEPRPAPDRRAVFASLTVQNRRPVG